MRTHARVAVIGGGALGCSLLYHLAKRGWTDTVLLEKHELTAGSTWHAAGLCTQFNSSINVTSLLMYGVDLFRRLEAETGQPVDFRAVGSIRLATTPRPDGPVPRPGGPGAQSSGSHTSSSGPTRSPAVRRW